MSRGNNFFRHNANNVGNVFLVARLPSAPNNTIDENCGSSLTVVGSMGGASRASSSLTRSRNRAISWSLAVGSVVTSGGCGGGALLLMVLPYVSVLRRSGAVAACTYHARPCRYFQTQSAVLGRFTQGHFKQHLAPVRH